MLKRLYLHPVNPQLKLVQEAAAVIERGGVIVYQTDTAYALGCCIGNKQALDRVRRIRRLSDKHLFSLLCRDIAEISIYSQVDNPTFRLLKAVLPGPYTFVLRATREVPRRVMNPRRKTIGVRLINSPIVSALLNKISGPLLTTTLIMPDAELPLTEPDEIENTLKKQVDLLLDTGTGLLSETSVVDLTDSMPLVLREGLGDCSLFTS